MRSKYTKAEGEKVHNLVVCALSAPTKSDAKKYISQLDYICLDVTGYSRGVLSELKAATGAASGRVQDKGRLMEIAYSCLYKFEMHCVE